MKCPVCSDEGARKHTIVAGRQQYICTRKGCGSVFFADSLSEYGHPQVFPKLELRAAEAKPEPKPEPVVAETVNVHEGGSEMPVEAPSEIREPEQIEAAIPPRPNLETLGRAQKAAAMHDWYEENKLRILEDYEKLPKDNNQIALRQKWDMGYTTWVQLRHRWLPGVFAKPSWQGSRTKTTHKQQPVPLPTAQPVEPPVRTKEAEAVADTVMVLPVIVELNINDGHIVIDETDLQGLSEYDFEKLWGLIGTIVRNRKRTAQ